MDPVSLTTLVDFMTHVGPTKQSTVEQFKCRGEYSPAVDFYREFREELQCRGRAGRPLRDFDAFIAQVQERKRSQYRALSAGIEKFARKSQFPWVDPPSSLDQLGLLTIRLNPEVGMLTGEEQRFSKVYCKEGGLNQHRARLVLELKQLALAPQPGTVLTLLDARTGRAHDATKHQKSLQPLLLGEAYSFRSIFAAVRKCCTQHHQE